MGGEGGPVTTKAVTMAEDTPGFVPRPPWIGGDLQTLRNFLVRPRHDLGRWPQQRLALDLADGSGDRLLARLHAGDAAAGRPLVVLVHGLTGCEDSTYIRASARTLLERGHPVLRLNLRGAGPGRPLARGGYSAGKSDDLRDALTALGAFSNRLLSSGLLLVGYSLGGNMLLKFLAEYGGDFPIRAAASVSAPIDLKATQVRIMAPRNRIYHAYLLSRMKQEALATPGGLSDQWLQAVRSARSVYDFDDRVVGPRNGFDGADHYYAESSGLRYLEGIDTPTLLIHARDDPWIPAKAYTGFDWTQNRRLVPALPTSGGHVGFHGKDSQVAWHDRRIVEFFGET